MSKSILFVIDEVELRYFEFNKLVTNFWLIHEFLKRNFNVSITTKNRLFLENAVAKAITFETKIKELDIVYNKNEIESNINTFDVVFFRPDPPVNIDYINACYVFDFIDTEKTLVINNPKSIQSFNEKFHVNYFPQYVPKNIVTSSKSKIIEFVQEATEAILKPLNRCFGSGVYYLHKNDKNLNSIITTATENEKTLVTVQKYLNGATNGDKRVLIIGETVLDECVMKLPGRDDFKFNAHNDESFSKSTLTENERNMAKDVAKILSKQGLYMVGLDVIDEKIIEINVTSPCYFIKEINAFYNTNFEEKILDALLNLIKDHHCYQKSLEFSSN